MILKKILSVQFLLFCIITLSAQVKPQDQPKFTILYLYTDWCSICRMQKNIIEHSPEIKELKRVAEFISLNAESDKVNVNILGENYRYISNGTSGLHELAYKFSDGQPVYPLWVFIENKTGTWTKHEGLMRIEDFKNISKTLTL